MGSRCGACFPFFCFHHFLSTKGGLDSVTAKQIFSRLAMAYVAFLIVAYGGQYAFAGL